MNSVTGYRQALSERIRPALNHIMESDEEILAGFMAQRAAGLAWSVALAALAAINLVIVAASPAFFHCSRYLSVGTVLILVLLLAIFAIDRPFYLVATSRSLIILRLTLFRFRSRGEVVITPLESVALTPARTILPASLALYCRTTGARERKIKLTAIGAWRNDAVKMLKIFAEMGSSI